MPYPATPLDILILSNGPGELITWVKPTLRALRQRLGVDRQMIRISVVLSPCPNASGNEADIAASYEEVDRVQSADHFFPFLLFGRTAESWDWRSQGVVIFLGGDQLFPVIIGKRLGYQTVLYCEWDARWQNWVDRFAVMKAAVADTAKPQFRHKFSVVGDLMTELSGHHSADTSVNHSANHHENIVGILPGSKRAKLMQGVPIMLAAADHIRVARPETKFVIPVAPTISLAELASYADATNNPAFELVDGVEAELFPGDADTLPHLITTAGTQVILHQSQGDRIPPYSLLQQCSLCLTTVGANTAELGALAVPMVMILPTNQLDAMRAWDGLPGILANLPGIGTVFAKVINQLALRKIGLLAWPNIWAGEQIVPELVGELYPPEIANFMLDYLNHSEKLTAMRQALQAARGEAGAADKLAKIVSDLIQPEHP